MYIRSNDQLAEVLIKSLRGSQIKFISFKLGAFNFYALTRGGNARIGFMEKWFELYLSIPVVLELPLLVF